MKIITVEFKKLKTLIKKEKFNTSGMFVPYQFIALKWNEKGESEFYHSIIASQNSWTNYPGIKIWTSNESKNPKREMLEYFENYLKSTLQYDSDNNNCQRPETEHYEFKIVW
jgi:hypothetical protein